MYPKPCQYSDLKRIILVIILHLQTVNLSFFYFIIIFQRDLDASNQNITNWLTAFI